MSVRVLEGDCRDVLRTLPDESVHCIVTSPPYWNLRDYGVTGQIGLEQYVDSWVAELVSVFREARRVLRDDGTCWVNLGDSYAGSRSFLEPDGESKNLGHQRGMTASRRRDNALIPRSDRSVAGLKPKDLIGQPWRVAFALQADGWYLRSEIIWHKLNPMPESTRDRPTKSHEQLFLLSKSERYWYDADAIAEPCSPNTHARYASANGEAFGMTNWARDGVDHSAVGYSRRKVASNGVGFGHGYDDVPKPRVKNNASFDAAMAVMPETRNSRSVWSLATEPFKEAHFATFPTELPRRCILAGCPEGGTVLDPFGGAGTTGLVADRLQRDALLIELNPKYADMARRRIAGESPLFAEVA